MKRLLLAFPGKSPPAIVFDALCYRGSTVPARRPSLSRTMSLPP